MAVDDIFESIVQGSGLENYGVIEDWDNHSLTNIRRLGYLMVGESDGCLNFECISGSPAEKLQKQLTRDSVPIEERLEIQRRYIKDAAIEDDDYMHRQWPEVFYTQL
ncbi:MAG: hypothetical protein M3Q36_04545 [bacterium]|nr:hypothetical protein [bacterium]